MFEKITNKFQFKFKDRVTAANILGESLKDKIKKQEEQRTAVVLDIPRGGVITADIVTRKLSTDNLIEQKYKLIIFVICCKLMLSKKKIIAVLYRSVNFL